MLLAVSALAGSIMSVPRGAGTTNGAAVEGGQGLVETEVAPGQEAEVGTGPQGQKDSSATGAAAGGKGLQCAAGRNGGKTDKGVTGNSIKLASTIVTSGPGSTFLGLSQYGMQAVVAKVNAAGGICGRQLKLRLVNDNWEAQRGQQTLKNFMNDEVFALPVVPSSEGLRAAGADIRQSGIPVVGSDGMLIDQYENPWIWPVATATITQVRVMAKYAFDKGARNFAIVYDSQYRFGVEGKDAYQKYVGTLPGARFVHAEPVQPNQPGYGPQIKNLDDACQADCDALIMLTDPGTAEVWVAGDKNYNSRVEFRMGASPLFNSRFGQNCKEKCDGMLVFTGYVPALEANVNLPGVSTYVNDVKAIKPDIDTTNQFLQGSYLGMLVFVEGLKKVGPNLTRARLQEVMNSLDYSSDLSSPLSWRANKRFANNRAQVWQIQAPSSFNGFRDLQTGWLQDPSPSR